MRKAKLTLHKKVGSKRECVCGNRLDYIDGKGFICPLQNKLGETNIIEVFIERTEDGFQIKHKKR